MSTSLARGAGRAALVAALWQAPAAAQTSLTIYSDGRVQVRRTLPAAVPAGASTHRLSLGALDPASLFALDSGVAVMGASYDESVDEENTMRRAVGLTLRFVPGTYTKEIPDTVSALVLGVNPERFRLSDGQVVFQRPGTALYPAELVLVEPALSLVIRAQAARPALRLGYFTTGASWQASYSVVLGKPGARVTGQASIPSVTVRAPDAEVQLLAGQVGRAAAFSDKRISAGLQPVGMFRSLEADAPATEESVGEAHLYTIPGRISLAPGVTSAVALFEPATAAWDKGYAVRGQIPYYGMLPQFGNEETSVPVGVWYTLTRRAGTPFGDLPLPGGVYRLYEPDGAGRLQLIGEAAAGHTAPGREVRLSAGSAFDLTAKRVQTSYATRRDSIRTIATADYRVTLTSAKDSVSIVEVVEERYGEWSVVSSSAPADKVSSTRTRFRLRIPARGEVVLTYRVRVVW
ncbi:MAG: hypothetical protein HOP28_10745 [Gemmatimonadales bacterium]|nr:hypothetical protein [Gemmatimonadales bacterium]